MARLVVSLLGPFQAALDEQPITRFESVKVRALLAYLASEASRPHRREALAALLWPDWPPQSAMSNLRYALADLRKNIGDRAANPAYLLIGRESLQLNREADLGVDLTEFESATQGSSTGQLQTAIHLYHGSFLEGFSLPDSASFEEWLLAKREYLNQQMLRLLSKQTEGCLEQGEYEQAEEFARRQIEMEPWREKAYQQLMRALSLRGERVQALARFEDLCKALQRELKVEPSEETIRLYRQIRDDSVDVQKEIRSARLALSEKPRHNLPAQLSTFISREKEQDEIKNLVTKNRLITLIGSGGVGKSRLALQVGERVLSEFSHSVWLVELAPLTDPALVPQAVCMALDVTPQGNTPALNVLMSYLRPKKTLLVIDNCEHLVDACAQLAEALLRACPDLRILATSREALGIEGENVYRVPSLSLADPTSGLQSIEQSEAVQLFVERARAVLPEYALTEANAPTIAQICQRLDGIALAIELAASRVRTLKADQIAARLDDAFRLLTSGTRTALPRHKTLGAMIDWSHDLLSEAEQVLFRRLSVFAGGWTLEAVEAVCENADTLDLLTHLVDKSLVVVDREQGKDARYYLLETIRQYGWEKLAEGGEGEQIRKRYVDYFLKLALEADQNLKGTKYMEAISRLEEEHANLLAALEWSFENRIEQGQQLVGALWWSWYLRGYRRLADQWIQKALAVRRDTPDPIQVKLLAARAVWWDDESAKIAARQSIAIYRQLEDHEGMAFSLITLGHKALLRSEYEQAITLLEESLGYCKEAGNMWGIRQSITRLGWVAQLQGNYEQAEKLYQKSLALSREANDPDCISWVLRCLGELAAAQGNYVRARAFYDQGLTIARAANLHSQISLSLTELGQISLYVGELEQARNLTEEALKTGREIDDKTVATSALRHLGKIAGLMGDHPQARSHFVDSLLSARETTNPLEIATSIIYIGLYMLSRGFPEKFSRLLGMAEGIAPEALVGEGHDLFKVETEQAIESSRTALGEEAYNAAYAAGHPMSLDEAVAYALRELEQ